jgi:uncharacterized protein YcfJ
MILRPGQYPSLGAMGMNNRVSSLRRVQGKPRYAYAPLPPPAPPAPYPYYPHHGETLYQADVVAVRTVVGPPEQRCWVEREQVSGGPNVPGAIVGGIIGGVLGHQIGSGRGQRCRDGSRRRRRCGDRRQRQPGAVYSQDVRRCAAVPSSAQPQYWDVTYVFRGRTNRAQLSFPPGPTITVNGRGEPRV